MNRTTALAVALTVAVSTGAGSLAGGTPKTLGASGRPTGNAATTTTTTATATRSAGAGVTPLRWRQYLAQRLVWRATCPGGTGTKNESAQDGIATECATFLAPLDWSDLTKGSIRIGMTRNRAAKPVTRVTKGAPGTPTAPTNRARRALFLNPGGPGMPAGPMVSMMALSKPAC